jgi:hypothetical protein
MPLDVSSRRTVFISSDRMPKTHLGSGTRTKTNAGKFHQANAIAATQGKRAYFSTSSTDTSLTHYRLGNVVQV